MPIIDNPCPVRALTAGPDAHWFGYYDKPPWDATGRYMLAMEAASVARMPLPGEVARIGLIDVETLAFRPIAETRAWNWQQGSMAQWMPTAPDREVIYNDAEDGRHVSVILDIHTGARRTLPRPVYDVSADGSFILSTSMARLAATRSVVGYAGIDDPFAADLHPAGDGIWRVDTATGAETLVLSLDQVYRLRQHPDMETAASRFEHITIAPGDARFFVLHRWNKPPGAWRAYWDRLLTCGTDGSDPRIALDDEHVSHFDWRDETHILTWARHRDLGTHFLLLTDGTDEVEVVGGDVLPMDGHCSYNPDRRWVLGDSYPSGGSDRILWLYEVATNTRVDIGSFASPPPYHKGDIRCDLHPRWSRDGREVCIDSVHEGTRQMYVIEVGGVVG
jgi:hypothetical protein